MVFKEKLHHNHNYNHYYSYSYHFLDFLKDHILILLVFKNGFIYVYFIIFIKIYFKIDKFWFVVDFLTLRFLS